MDEAEHFAANEENVDISKQQLEEIKRRIDYYDANPHELVSWEEVQKNVKVK